MSWTHFSHIEEKFKEHKNQAESIKYIDTNFFFFLPLMPLGKTDDIVEVPEDFKFRTGSNTLILERKKKDKIKNDYYHKKERLITFSSMKTE